MIKEFSYKEYLQTNSRGLLPCTCENPACHKTFYIEKRYIKRAYSSFKNKNKKRSLPKYCSVGCHKEDKERMATLITSCINCEKKILKKFRLLKTHNSHNYFCGSACAASYNNKNKSFGFRRSKIEIWIEKQLKKKYKDLKIFFNDKTAINSELDIYIPELNLAFEINGIFHYKPIYGIEKFEAILKNDAEKKILCEQNKIKLIIVNTSKQMCFSAQTSLKYLNYIENEVELHMTNSTSFSI